MAARRARSLAVASLVAALLVAVASAQSGCTTVLINLYPCLNYISGNESTPTSTCCSQLASVVKNQPQCLCSAIGGDSSSLGGITINKTRALELPNACKVVTPPASKCNTAGGNPPAASTPATQTPAGSSSTGTGGGSKTTPTSPYLINGGASLRGPVGVVLALVGAAAYAASAV